LHDALPISHLVGCSHQGQVGMHTHSENSAARYGIVAQLLHWLVAAMVFVQLGLGIYAGNLPVSLARLKWLSWHKALGIILLALVLLRLAWRAFHSPPALPAFLPRHERFLALVVHALLYAMLVLAPLSGWLYASAAGLSVTVRGLRIPNLVERNPGLAAAFHDTHVIFVVVLASLIVLHVAGALRHALRHDGIMSRMLPWRRT